MKRSAFTLVELIFVIVIIGVLAAVAVPKYKSLEDNAKIGNVAKFYGDITSSVKGSYMNSVTLNELNASDVNMSQLYDFQGKGWSVGTDDANYSVAASDGNITMRVVYNNAGQLDINITAPTNSQAKLTKKTGLTFTTGSDVNTTVINLAE